MLCDKMCPVKSMKNLSKQGSLILGLPRLYIYWAAQGLEDQNVPKKTSATRQFTCWDQNHQNMEILLLGRQYIQR